MDVESLINPHLRAMQPYTPIVPFEVLSQRLGRRPEDIVKLDANENPYGPSPRALQALARADGLHIYPDPDQTALRKAIADHIGIPPEHILCGAGADEVIDLVARAFVRPGDAVVDLPPTFGMYRWVADVMNANYVAAPRRADFSVDVHAVERLVNWRSEIGDAPVANLQSPVSNLQSPVSNLQPPTSLDSLIPKLLFIADPNNPDGSTICDEQLRALLALPVVVVLDEAYVDFSARPSRVSWALAYDNLIVLRTFSKLAGMAGLRVGYGVFPRAIIQHLWKIKQPYTPNVAGTVAAIAALSDREYLRENVQRLVAERQRMSELLGQFDWLHVFPSEANFVLCRVAEDAPVNHGETRPPAARRLKQALEQQGVLVRYFDREGLRDCVRISVGRPDQTDRLIAALKALGE
ncbi:MAG: aminotransferase class I/II-fold pyridoxal phosphate-dependent enzyme [Chloroflexi bacterium]|jgi:histidinol-phosphate aminotransferase|uniref:Histidinol-phosphate aminotransferase n=1 Tax=Candidatus Thermofonsia Clade 3 bacterium TaxID=2364212 RepID=A0A2M8QB89_9CHLR|nr:aminotransferase class I/II-fold pyridoxal phosphate-dependent enzyme [Candidatus Roseilinea sp. NK_OTU-006]PJF47055.1 MAG: histidinol-phosphate aminotransferase [Candidatus Thermofonsia Clade 3 bacterium]RMG62565.1 MAG: aminotransferase class I/II-fold pyridoxal phosphate-dependent enzyme [Chloroflexota bacterium]